MLAHEHQERGHEATPCASWGRLPRGTSPRSVDQAEARYQQALALAEELGMRPLQAHCHLGLGTLYAKVGRREQARTSCLPPSTCTGPWT